MQAFRRFQWLFVRIEVELRKIQAQRPELGVLVPLAGQALHPHEDPQGGVEGGSGGASLDKELPSGSGGGGGGVGGGGGGGGAEAELAKL